MAWRCYGAFDNINTVVPGSGAAEGLRDVRRVLRKGLLALLTSSLVPVGQTLVMEPGQRRPSIIQCCILTQGIPLEIGIEAQAFFGCQVY